MKFFCPSCGNSNETKIIDHFPEEKVCNSCEEVFTASEANQLFDTQIRTRPRIVGSRHVFCSPEERSGFFFRSSLEKCIFYTVTITGVIILTAAILSKAFK